MNKRYPFGFAAVIFLLIPLGCYKTDRSSEEDTEWGDGHATSTVLSEGLESTAVDDTAVDIISTSATQTDTGFGNICSEWSDQVTSTIPYAEEGGAPATVYGICNVDEDVVESHRAAQVVLTVDVRGNYGAHGIIDVVADLEESAVSLEDVVLLDGVGNEIEDGEVTITQADALAFDVKFPASRTWDGDWEYFQLVVTFVIMCEPLLDEHRNVRFATFVKYCYGQTERIWKSSGEVCTMCVPR